MRHYPLLILLIPLIVAIYMSDQVRRQGETSITTESTSGDSSGIAAASTLSLARIVDYPIERAKTWRYQVDILSTDSAVAPFEHGYIYLIKDSLRSFPTLGDTLWIEARWQAAEHQEPHAIVYRWQVRGVADGRQLSMVEHARRIRQRLIKRYEELGVTGDELATLSALTLGYRDSLNRDIRDHFRQAGAAHVLAVSGLHTGVLYVILLYILTLGGRCKPMLHETVRRWALYVTIILILWAYALLTGMSASVVRSVTMLTIIHVGLLLRRQVFSINTLAAAAIVLLLFRPSDLYNVGFWLSFSAVASLILLSPHVKGYFSGLVVASLAAQVGTLPITLYCFGQVSHYFLLTNILVVPLVGILFCLGLTLLTVGAIPGVGSVLAYLTSLIIRLMHIIVAAITELPCATLTLRCTLPMMLLLYAAILTGVLALRRSLNWLILTAVSLVGFGILYTLA